MRLERIYNANLIPFYLVGQLKDREFEVPRFYQFMASIQNSPESLLYVIMNEANCIVGYLWMTLETLDMIIHINHLSLDEEYWKKGIIEKFIHREIVKIMEDFGVKKCYWSSSRPKAFQKLGYKKAKMALIEFNREA